MCSHCISTLFGKDDMSRQDYEELHMKTKCEIKISNETIKFREDLAILRQKHNEE